MYDTLRVLAGSGHQAYNLSKRGFNSLTQYLFLDNKILSSAFEVFGQLNKNLLELLYQYKEKKHGNLGFAGSQG